MCCWPSRPTLDGAAVISHKEHRYLQVIEGERVVTQDDMAKLMCTTTQAVGKILNSMTDRGLLTKRECALPGKPYQYLLTLDSKTLVNVLRKLK